VRAGDLRAHYTDFGILPRASLGLYTWRTVWTLHGAASPHPALVVALFAIAAVFALLLALGWRTRLATFVSWLLLTSLQYRNPALVFGGDVMLRMLLFWGLFLPLGARWSLEARRRPPAADSFVSVASLALVVQIALVYVCSALNRTGPTWWDGRALHDALHFDQFASGLAIRLRAHEA
jgi:HTTM domain